MRIGVNAQVGNRLRNVLAHGRNKGAAMRPGGKNAGGPGVPGMVEEFSRRLVVGWISVPADAAPVRVDLYLGNLKAASTYATPDSSMSGYRSALRRDDDTSAPAPLVHDWQVPLVPGPADDRRNSGQSIRTFSFRIRGIWPWVKKGTRITIRVNGQPLPIYGHGMFLSPPRNGRRSVRELAAKFEAGYLLSQTGKVALSKRLDTEWQSRVMELYARTRRIVADEFGHDIFFIYGTLLGAVREGGFIGHDEDFDAAFISKHTDGGDAATELQEIGLALIRHGLDVECMFTALHIRDPKTNQRIDLFHTYFDDEGRIRFPFGIAGTNSYTTTDWKGTREIEFGGGTGLVPVGAEKLVAHLYGDDWRSPKPGFNWKLDRTDSARDGLLSTQQRTKVYWANFYNKTQYTSGSTFFEFINSWDGIPNNIIDIGCGDGRDSCAFGAAGRTVLGVDQSPVGIEHASAHADEVGLAGNVSFRTCDVADVDDLGRAMDQITEAAHGPVAFYMRFFLHAIPEDVQRGLMKAIDTHARPGDYLVAEFRTDKDAVNAKVHTKHYRRFQNAVEFRDSLGLQYGFEVLHFEEGTGLSPYKGEDPVLTRVVAKR
jgi:ubiquinone/menaquinone biosynthesis C-methylase UbiE